MSFTYDRPLLDNCRHPKPGKVTLERKDERPGELVKAVWLVRCSDHIIRPFDENGFQVGFVDHEDDIVILRNPASWAERIGCAGYFIGMGAFIVWLARVIFS